MQQENDLINRADTEMALTFSLDGEIFAIPVSHVSEIIDPLPLTKAPSSDPFAPGLVNVRGVIAPFVDLRQRLGMKPATLSETSRVLVLDLTVEGERTFVATQVDDVFDIIETPIVEIEAVPELGIRWPTDLIKGVVRKSDTLVILLDVETAFTPARAPQLAKA